MDRTETTVSGGRSEMEHGSVGFGRHTGRSAGTTIAESNSMAMTTPGNTSRTLTDQPLVAAVPLGPSLALDELLLNLLPLVEAGVLEVVVDPTMTSERLETAAIVLEECAGCRQGSESARRLSFRLTGNLPTPRNEESGHLRCLDASSEVVPEIHRLLQWSLGLEGDR